VKTVLLTSLFLALARPSEAVPSDLPPQMECGTYLARGHVGLADRIQYILTLQYGSYSPYELILLGGKLTDKMNHLGQEITVRVYVPQPIHGNNRPFVFLQDVLENKILESDIELEHPDPCGLKDKFHL